MSLLSFPLVANVLILVPVCAGILGERPWALAAYGARAPGRQILLSMYGAILVLSVALLLVPHRGMTLGMVSLQIVYKLTTPLTVGTLRHPVVLSNLAIAAAYGAALAATLAG